MLTRTYLCAALTLSAPLTAQAQTVDLATRRLLIEQAQERGRAGDHSGAIELGQRALRMQSTPSLLLFLAGEQLAAGRPHVAFGLAEQCLFDANRAALPNREDVLRACRQLSQRVRDESAVLVLRGDAVAGLVVTVDGEALASGQLGAPVFVAAGARVVRAEAMGYQRYEATIEARARATVEHALTMVSTVDAAMHEAQPARPSAAQTSAARPEPAVRAESTSRARPRPAPTARRSLAGPIAVTAAGGAVMIAAVPLFLLRNSALDGCVIEGDAVVCTNQDAVDRVPTARALGAASIGALAGGAALAAAGAVWWALAARRPEAPIVALGPGSITVAGVWR